MREIADILSVNFDNLEEEIINFFNELQIEINFNNLEITKEGFIKAIQGLNQDRLKNNPRFLSKLDIAGIYSYNSNY